MSAPAWWLLGTLLMHVYFHGRPARVGGRQVADRGAAAHQSDTMPAWWFDPEAPPRVDGEELPIPARKDGGEHGGGRKGLTPGDYREAVQEGDNMAAIGRILDVNEKTVREQCKRHGIEVPSIGGVPG
ncbi:hypothetical protein [Salinibacter ruber]|nr:hypothetical protein [Salinibacter ruber]